VQSSSPPKFKVRILLASSEVFPFSKTGGLGDAVGALAKALAAAGHEVLVVTPFYRDVRALNLATRVVDWRFDVTLGTHRHLEARLHEFRLNPRLTINFIDQPDFFERGGIYSEHGHDYRDNAERFIFFSKCAAHLARHAPFKPDVVHGHDWPTGILPALIQQERVAGRWPNCPRAFLTIHNLAYQGVFPRHAFALTGLPAHYFHVETAEYFGQVNFLKTGIATADGITTVSPRYAREIMTQEYGAGLDGILRKRQKSLVGILNGVDYDEWNTTKNPRLAASYSEQDLTGKATCKASLQKELRLPVNASVPMFGTVTRLVEQKGINLLIGALEEMLTSPMQFVLLGSGDANYQSALHALRSRFPDRISFRIGYDDTLAHQIEAGSDFYLMPSRFEPCGLNQLYSLRYGTIPIVRRTGGLDDTVVDASDDIVSANGIKFTEAAPQVLAKSIRKAQLLFEDTELLNRYRRSGMRADFSWDRSVRHYVKVYAPTS
jgi:starch synthase